MRFAPLDSALLSESTLLLSFESFYCEGNFLMHIRGDVFTFYCLCGLYMRCLSERSQWDCFNDNR